MQPGAATKSYYVAECAGFAGSVSCYSEKLLVGGELLFDKRHSGFFNTLVLYRQRYGEEVYEKSEVWISC